MSLNGKEVKRILCLIGCPFGITCYPFRITRFAPTKAKFLEGIFFPRVKTLINQTFSVQLARIVCGEQVRNPHCRFSLPDFNFSDPLTYTTKSYNRLTKTTINCPFILWTHLDQTYADWLKRSFRQKIKKLIHQSRQNVTLDLWADISQSLHQH